MTPPDPSVLAALHAQAFAAPWDAAAFADRTGRGPRRPAELREVLRRTRADGYAGEDGEVTLGLRSVGVAVAMSSKVTSM